MGRHVQFVTPENIEVSYELAGIGSRFIAAFVDLIIQAVMILVVLIMGSIGAAGASFMDRITSGAAPALLLAIAGFIVFVILFGYSIAFELMGAGRTPGKRVAGLRVVRDGGYPLDPYASIVRNLVRIVDFLPLSYGIGLISIFLNREYKRLGDLAAGTIVIKEGIRRPARPIERYVSSAVLEYLPLIRNVDQLTDEEFTAIRRFVERRLELDPSVQGRIAQRIAAPLIQRLGIEIPITHQLQYADLLEAFERKYMEERGVLGV